MNWSKAQNHWRVKFVAFEKKRVFKESLKKEKSFFLEVGDVHRENCRRRQSLRLTQRFLEHGTPRSTEIQGKNAQVWDPYFLIRHALGTTKLPKWKFSMCRKHWYRRSKDVQKQTPDGAAVLPPSKSALQRFCTRFQKSTSVVLNLGAKILP